MEQKYYRVIGFPYAKLAENPDVTVHNPTIESGTIIGEVDANNIRKQMSTSMPDYYFRMVEVNR